MLNMKKLFLTLFAAFSLFAPLVASAAFVPLSVPAGGIGWGNILANTLLIGNGTGRLATTSAGTNGFVLALVNGIPSWVATSSIQNITLTTTGSSGAATLAGMTLNIPQYTGGGGSGTVSTSSVAIVGNLAYWTSAGFPSLLGNVATTSVVCSGNTTCTAFTAIGGAPITISSTGGGTGLSTSSPTTNDGYLVYNSAGAGSAYTAATTSLSISGPFAIANPIGVLKNGAVTYWGLATTSQPASSNLLVSNGAAGVFGVATGTVSAGVGISLDSAVRSVIGGSLQITNSSPLSGLSAGYPFSFSNPTLTWLGLSTTTNSGMSAGNLYVGSGGIFQTAASSSIFGYTPLNPTRQITVSSGNGQIVSSAGAQDLSADRTWTLTYTGLATTTQPTTSQLLVSNGVAGVYGVSTTSETCSSGVTCATHAVLTGGGAITLSTINAGVLGAQTNSTLPTSQATSTLYGGSTGGMVLGWDNASGGIKWVATSSSAGGITSVTATAPLFSSGGATPNITYTGLATTSALTSSNLLYSTNGAAGVQGVATTSVTCSGNTTCTAFTAIGSSPITISSTGVGTGLSTTSPVAASNLLVYSSVGAGAAYGVATTTLSIGLGLSYSGTFGSLVGGASGSLTIATSSLYSGTTGQFPYFSGTNTITATSSLFVTTAGKLGIGTTTPNSYLEINGSAHVEIQRLATSTSMTVDYCSSNNMLIMGVGSANIAFSWTNANLCPGKSILLSNYVPSTGSIGTTTFSGGSGSGPVIWSGGINPGSTVVNSTTDDFCFVSTASTTSYIAASLCGQH